MITHESLRLALEKIFFAEDTTKYKYIVPIKGGFFVPSITDPSDPTSTWLGYRILEMYPRTHMIKIPGEVSKQVRIDFRLVAMGPAAEEFITSTLLWENRVDVKTAFESDQDAQIMYDRRRVYTHPVQQEGFADDLLWVTDMHAMSAIKREFTTTSWFPE